MKLVTPITVEKKQQLEKSLKEEEKRFLDASHKAVLALREDFHPEVIGKKATQWLRRHPVEGVLFAVAAGILIGRSFKTDRKLPPPIELA